MILKKKIEHFHSKIIFILFLLIFHLSDFSFAQDTIPPSKSDDDIQQQLESIVENTNNEEADYTDLMEALIYYMEHPVNINNTDREELQALGLLSDIQISNLTDHIKKYGK